MNDARAAAVELRPRFTWGRWGQWCAHLFDGDRQMCSTAHGTFRGRNPGPTPPLFHRPDLASSGLPFGRVCERCARAFRKLGIAT